MSHLYPAFFLLAASALVRADTIALNPAGHGFENRGTLWTVPDPVTAGAFDLTAIDGEVDNMAITGLLPTGTHGNSGYQTHLFFNSNVGPGTFPSLDSNGLTTKLPSVAESPAPAPAAIPEPPTLLLLGSSLFILAFSRNRRTWAEHGPLPNILPPRTRPASKPEADLPSTALC